MNHLVKTTLAAFTLVLTFGLALPASAAGAADTRLVADQNTEKTATFTIDRMTCAMCPITVRKAMEKVAGVLSVETDYDSKTAIVVFDPAKVNTDAIAAASANAGYPARLTAGS